MFTDKPYHLYHSTLGLVCVVPRPTLTGVAFSSNGEPYAVIYTSPETGKDTKYPTLGGLNIEDYQEHKPVLIIYVLGDGTLLAADKAAIARSTESTNRSCSKETPCFSHWVNSLKVLDQQPEFDLNPPLGTPVFSF